MEVFPFSQLEWQEVTRASNRVVNALLVNDYILHSSYVSQLRELLLRLSRKYGDHPVLLETEADLCAGPNEQPALYNRAIEMAEQAGIPSWSIRLSFARLLLGEYGNYELAAFHLQRAMKEASRLGEQDAEAELKLLLQQVKRPPQM